MDISVSPFRDDDLIDMDMRKHEAALPLSMVSAMCHAARMWTLRINGEVMLCGGDMEYPMNAGHYHIFLIPSVNLNKHSMVIAKLVKKWFHELIGSDGFIRAETIAFPDDLHNRWLSFLGMEKEGYVRKAFGTKDYELWGYVNA